MEELKKKLEEVEIFGKMKEKLQKFTREEVERLQILMDSKHWKSKIYPMLSKEFSKLKVIYQGLLSKIKKIQIQNP